MENRGLDRDPIIVAKRVARSLEYSSYIYIYVYTYMLILGAHVSEACPCLRGAVKIWASPPPTRFRVKGVGFR